MREHDLQEISISVSPEEAEFLIAALACVRERLPEEGDDADAYTRELAWHLDRKLRKALAREAADA
jgi:hypothetical protein